MFKHYWIVVKLLLTIGATILLFVHIQPISFMARTVLQGPLTGTEHRGLQVQLVVDAALALIVLLATTTISVYKPWGMTSYGASKLRKKMPNQASKSKGLYVIIGLVILAILFAIIHLKGGGLHSH